METIDTTRLVSEDLIRAGYIVFLNKKNTLGLPQFHTQGVGNSVPDLFFYDPFYSDEIFDPDFIPRIRTTIRAGFLELKSGDHLERLIDAINMLTQYYGNFITEKAKFFIEGKQIHNVDCFLLATEWSRTGMLYKGDEDRIPKPIPFISEKYNIAVHPHTMDLHSFQRYLKKKKRIELRNLKEKILPNKINTETGIMICKNPLDETIKVSYEYYAWMGNKIKPVLTKPRFLDEIIKTKGRIQKETEKAIYIESKRNRHLWLPKSKIKYNKNEAEDWQDIEIPRWLYKKNEEIFGNL